MEKIALKIQDLGDLELAVLLSLVAEQHCIITTKNKLVPDLARELELVRSICTFLAPNHLTDYQKISTRVFNVSCALVHCSASTTLDDFRQGVLVNAPADREEPSQFSTPRHVGGLLFPPFHLSFSYSLIPFS